MKICGGKVSPTIAKLDYPTDKLEIHVDDSTDDSIFFEQENGELFTQKEV
jgi:hypothetical protein